MVNPRTPVKGIPKQLVFLMEKTKKDVMTLQDREKSFINSLINPWIPDLKEVPPNLCFVFFPTTKGFEKKTMALVAGQHSMLAC